MMQTNTLPARRARGLLELPPLGLGCWAIGGPFDGPDGKPRGFTNADDAESRRSIRRALELGITYFDTADMYGAGHSERLLGEALGRDRAAVTISTKFGSVIDETARRHLADRSDPAFVREACEASLRRLGTDYIDLYFLHLWSFPEEAIPEMLGVLEALVVAGKIRAYGWSTDRPDALEAFAAGTHCAAEQVKLNVFEDAPALLDLAERADLVAVNRTPLAMGVLSGKYGTAGAAGEAAAGATARGAAAGPPLAPPSPLPAGDVRGTTPDWVEYFRDGRVVPEFQHRVDAVRDVLTSGGRTPAQGALAWIWARSPRTVPIPGFTRAKQVEENAGALAKGPLSAAQMAEIDGILRR